MSPDWVDGMARSLIQHAARNAPASLSERLEEEWLADFEGRGGRLARLRFGVGCCWATRVIAHEYLEPKLAAAGSATGSKVMTAIAHDNFSFVSRRTTAVALIIGLHAVIIYGFATGLVQRAAVAIVPPLEQSRVEVVNRDIEIDPEIPPVGAPVVIGSEVVDHTRVIEAPPQNPLKRVLGGPGKAFPNTEDFYPPTEIRQGRTGISTVQVCTDVEGRLTAAPTLAQSSGSAGLDEGALKLAKAGSGHYRATTEDGRAVSSCYAFRVRFDFRK